MCINESECSFFTNALRDTPAIILEAYRHKYCNSNENCARKVVAGVIGPDRVPVDLGPHQAAEAMTLLAQHGETRPGQYFL